jgi:hypothetical protein
MKLMHSHSIHQVVNDGMKTDSHKRMSDQTSPTSTDAYEAGSGSWLQAYRGPSPVQNRHSWLRAIKSSRVARRVTGG